LAYYAFFCAAFFFPRTFSTRSVPVVPFHHGTGSSNTPITSGISIEIGCIHEAQVTHRGSARYRQTPSPKTATYCRFNHVVCCRSLQVFIGVWRLRDAVLVRVGPRLFATRLFKVHLVARPCPCLGKPKTRSCLKLFRPHFQGTVLSCPMFGVHISRSDVHHGTRVVLPNSSIQLNRVAQFNQLINSTVQGGLILWRSPSQGPPANAVAHEQSVNKQRRHADPVNSMHQHAGGNDYAISPRVLTPPLAPPFGKTP